MPDEGTRHGYTMEERLPQETLPVWQRGFCSGAPLPVEQMSPCHPLWISGIIFVRGEAGGQTCDSATAAEEVCQTRHPQGMWKRR